MKTQKAFSLLLVSILIASTLAFVAPRAYAQPTLEIVPNFQSFGPTDEIGTTFTITCEVFGIANMYGVDIQIGWDTAWIHYVSHVKKIPVETYPDGILHSPTIPVKNTVDETASMPGSAPGAMYWLSEASMAPAAVFNGHGIAFEMTFVIVDQPLEPEPDVTTYIQILASTLADNLGSPIVHTTVDGAVELLQMPFEYPPLPKLTIDPDSVSNIPACNNFDISIILQDEFHDDLHPLWDPAGFDMILNFDPTLIEGVSVTIDPDGWFNSFFPDLPVFVIKDDIDNMAGTVWIAFLGLGSHSAVFGQGRLAEVTFHSIYDDESLPLAECDLTLSPTTIAGFPHPERPQDPWFNSELSPPLPHVINNGHYQAKYTPAVGIDIYTQYPDGFNGIGGPFPSDMFWPQKEVILHGFVMYNHWPEQQKDVAFQIIDPHGVTWAIICNRTNEDGIVWIHFRLPWPCDDPEYWFGVWTVVATVDIACTVYTDTLEFKYDYHVRVWKTTLDDTTYAHDDAIWVTIEFGTVSMQEFDVLFTITGTDETGVPFGFDYGWATAGGAEYCTYANGTITLHMLIPKFARAGSGTIYVQVLHNWPTLGGDSIYPTLYPYTIQYFIIEAA